MKNALYLVMTFCFLSTSAFANTPGNIAMKILFDNAGTVKAYFPEANSTSYLSTLLAETFNLNPEYDPEFKISTVCKNADVPNLEECNTDIRVKLKTNGKEFINTTRLTYDLKITKVKGIDTYSVSENAVVVEIL